MSFTTKEGSFATADYVVFCILCITSCAGGIWYSVQGTRKKNVENVKDYLLGGKSMSTLPVAMSLVATYVSGVTVLGTPAEIYNYGLQYWMVLFGIITACVIISTIYLPVFCTLQLSSSYEYLELRFNRHVRAVASILFLVDEILFLPMVVYVPALAFNQLTGASVYVVGCIMLFICGLYTVLGGLRAVVFTDSVQIVIMFFGVILVAVVGTVAVGGVGVIIDVAGDSGRLTLNNWSFSPYERQTGWGAVFGGAVYWTCFNSVNQTMVQRYIALPTKKKAIQAVAIFCCGVCIAVTLCVWCGLAAWTAWVIGGCNPAGAPLVDDHMLPAFVTWLSTKQQLPGLDGVFLAGVFGAALSSLSAVLNACSLVGVEDLLRGWLQLRMEPFQEGLIARSIAVVLAVSAILMLYVVSKMGGVLGVATALSAIAASTTCGIFTLGIVCWWVGPRGGITGAIAGALVAGTVSLGSQAAAVAGLRAPPMHYNETCAGNVTIVQTIDPETIFPLFRLSFHWIAPMGLFTTVTVGAIVGWLWDERSKRKLDAELFTPCVWRWLPEEAITKTGETRRLAAREQAERLAPSSSPLILSSISGAKI